MKEKTAALWVAVIAIVIVALAPPLAQATIVTTYTQPDAGYTSGTSLLPITVADYALVSAVTNGAVTANFSPEMEARTTPGSWGTWNSPPDTETSTPRLLYSKGTSSVDIAFSVALYLFGLEAEPNSFSVVSVTLEYYMGPTLIGSITQSIDGVGGAKLLAARLDSPFDKARIYAVGDEFGIANLRVSTDPGEFAPVPEPSLLLMCGGGLAVLFLARFFWTHREKQ